MANNYTSYSFTVPLDDARAAIAEYDRLCEEYDPDNLDIEVPHPVFGNEEFYAPPTLVFDDGEVWFTDDGGEGDVDAAIAVVQWLLTKPGAPDEVLIEWASTCSKPRVGEFGGGAALVTRKGVASICTGNVTELLRAMLPQEATS